MIPFKKWTEKPKNKKYIYLESDKHYLVLAYEEGTTFGVKVECQHCPERTAIQLQKVNDHYQISNWTKHVRKCFKSNNLDNQQTLKQVQSKCSSATLIKACKLHVCFYLTIDHELILNYLLFWFILQIPIS